MEIVDRPVSIANNFLSRLGGHRVRLTRRLILRGVLFAPLLTTQIVRDGQGF